jgi:hypothetical protein
MISFTLKQIREKYYFPKSEQSSVYRVITLHLLRLCGFKEIYFNFIKLSQHARHYICQI